MHLADWQPHEASLFQLNQPVAVRHQFTLQALHLCFDAAAAVRMPDDVLRLIGDYAPIEVPFLPLVHAAMRGAAAEAVFGATVPPQPTSAGEGRQLAAVVARVFGALVYEGPELNIAAQLASSGIGRQLAATVARAYAVADSHLQRLPNAAQWHAQFCELVEDRVCSADLVPDCACMACHAPLTRMQDRAGRCLECGARLTSGLYAGR